MRIKISNKFCFDSALDDDPVLLDDPTCETIMYMGGCI
jgi:hypothetical protein